MNTTAEYATYDDGSPISNRMRAADGNIWWRKGDEWTDGVMVGPWGKVEREYGPFTTA